MSKAETLKTILVVDDTPSNRRLLVAVLQAAAFETIEAEDGAQALQILSKKKVDAVVSDILMPNMDGFRLCHAIKTGARTSEIPVLLQSSAYLSSEDMKFSETVGADAFLRRPYDLDTLVKAVHEMTSGTRPKPAVAAEKEVILEDNERMASALARTHQELVRVSKEAQEESAQFVALVNTLPVAYVSSDERGAIHEWNPAAERIFGHSKSEAKGRLIEDLLFHEPAGRIISNSPEGQLAEHTLADGKKVLCDWHHSVITSPTGKLRGMHSVGLDVTERVASETSAKALLEEVRNLSSRLVDAQEQERRHIAVELHDEVGQMLLALRLTLELAKRSNSYIGDADKLVGDLIGRVRSMSLDLRPPMLDDLGLLPALSWLCERSGKVGIPVYFEHKGLKGLDLSNRTRTAAFRIVQEAITNSARHSDASRVNVHVWTTPELLNTEIQDDGVGFDVKRVWERRDSTGLAGMLERASSARGTFCVESAPGEGTIIMAALPIAV